MSLDAVLRDVASVGGLCVLELAADAVRVRDQFRVGRAQGAQVATSPAALELQRVVLLLQLRSEQMSPENGRDEIACSQTTGTSRGCKDTNTHIGERCLQFQNVGAQVDVATEDGIRFLKQNWSNTVHTACHAGTPWRSIESAGKRSRWSRGARQGSHLNASKPRVSAMKQRRLRSQSCGAYPDRWPCGTRGPWLPARRS